jgi:ubiquinone/menaquinone biosynthesis C-methylase UbiE
MSMHWYVTSAARSPRRGKRRAAIERRMTEEHQMASVDVYRITDQLDDATLDVIVTRLETRARQPRFIAMMNDYFDAMKVESAAAVLDLGSGTAAAARAIARRKGFGGRVTAIDVSPYLTAAAKRLAEEEGLAAVIDFGTGDSQCLHLADASFDAAVAHTLLSHVQDPMAVLRELARVVKPGGHIGIFDGDYASLTFGNDDAAKGKTDDETLIDAIVTQPRMMRQMPQMLREAGLALTAWFSYVVADIGKADFWAPAIPLFLRLLPKAGAMTEREAQAWADALTDRSARDVFFGACNYYSYVAARRGDA